MLVCLKYIQKNGVFIAIPQNACEMFYEKYKRNYSKEIVMHKGTIKLSFDKFNNMIIGRLYLSARLNISFLKIQEK